MPDWTRLAGCAIASPVRNWSYISHLDADEHADDEVQRADFRPGPANSVELTMIRCVLAAFAALSLCGQAWAQGVEVTYQGQLKQSGTPFRGMVDMEFRLFNELIGGTQIGATVVRTDVSVEDGLFQTLLDFTIFDFEGFEPRYLEIRVDGETLGPRQQVTAAPVAAYALSSADAAVSPWIGVSGGLEYNAGRVRIGSDSFGVARLRVDAGGASLDGATITTANDGGFAVEATASGAGGTGVRAIGSDIGLSASASASSGSTIGVFGSSESSAGHGVLGWGTAFSGDTVGVAGRTDSTTGRGVHGQARASAGTNFGVFGESASSSGRGVHGEATASTGTNFGVFGESASSDGRGVEGLASASVGENFGVRGVSNGTVGRGVYGWATATSGPNVGVLGRSDSFSGLGVRGEATTSSGAGDGVWGITHSPAGWGVYGQALDSGGGIGVRGSAANTGFGVFAAGNLGASGTKSFVIDHPLDPENRFLTHYSAEGPEPQNIYNGVVTLDGTGEAWVELPDYFFAINRDPRYQLTCIGGFAGVYVADEIDFEAETSRFRIAGGMPGLKVSWEVKAIRDDPYVRTNGAPVEVEKAVAARGTYLHPELYGQPPERGQDHRRGESP
jgi:hypothetical protein